MEPPTDLDAVMQDNVDEKESEDEELSYLSLSQHIFSTWRRVADPAVPAPDRLKHARALRGHLPKVDAYISMHDGGPCQSHLPTLEWNKSFRKAYTICMWLRPRMLDRKVEISKDNADDEMSDANVRRVFYRLGNSAEDSKSLGVCVTHSPWRVSPEDSSLIETHLTAYTLPYSGPFSDAKNMKSQQQYTSLVQVPLVLQLDKWQLVAFSHTCPYLTRPLWTVSVDGMLMGQSELSYPSLERVTHMDYNVILQNVVAGGIQRLLEQNSKSDDRKTASELQAAPMTESIAMDMDLAALALYPEAIENNMLAVIAEAGPNLALQKGGRIIPTLPPIPNWSKGTSLEGPKVGIPMAVHTLALEIQKLSGKLTFGVSAVDARVLGASGAQHQRIILPMQLHPGSTEASPRVGLIQPAQAVRILDEDMPVLYVNGRSSLYHAVSDYLLQAPNSENIDPDGQDYTKNLSVSLQEQQVATFFVLPFFLALCPPGKAYDLQEKTYLQSIAQLYALYCNKAQLAVQLVYLLAEVVEAGSRYHEELLQGGYIHVLAVSLRLSLLRARRVKMFHDSPTSLQDLFQRFSKTSENTSNSTSMSTGGGTSLTVNIDETGQLTTDRCPSYVPIAIAQACASLVEACCGPPLPPSGLFEDLSPAMQIRRTSDLALTAVFGLALDWDLWGGDMNAASIVLKCLADRYGGFCLTSGYILRGQISVQFFLDSMRLRLDNLPNSAALEQVAQHCSSLLKAMLLSSLSNRRSVTQGEHDVSACMSALCDAPLGSAGAHVILDTIVGILAWCEILPMEATSTDFEPNPNDDQKMQVASRLGRNLLMSQFHEVVAPMLLSRTAFSGDRSQSSVKTDDSATMVNALSWQNHWQLSLLLFSWVSSIAGPEGLIAAQSTGSLLVASAHAGALQGALRQIKKTVLSALFLPPPAMALMIGSSIRTEWSYSDLLSDRLQIMVPLVPGAVVSILSRKESDDDMVTLDDATTLVELLVSVGGAFHRVYGGTVHSTEGARRQQRNNRDGHADSIKAARTFVPSFLVAALAIQGRLKSEPTDDTSSVKVLRPCTSNESLRRNDMDSWVDVSNESVVGELKIRVPDEKDYNAETSRSLLLACQNGALDICAGLITKAMALGGTGASVTLWQKVVSTLQEYMLLSVGKFNDSSRVVKDDETTSGHDANANDKPEPTTDAETVARDLLCRLASIVIIKSLRRDCQWALWDYEKSTAIAGLCGLVEEKNLLQVNYNADDPNQSRLSDDQIMLLCALSDLLEYGRDATGWCQLALPTMASAKSDGSTDDLSAASKLLLPSLQPTLRVILGCVPYLPSSINISLPVSATSSPQESNEFTEDRRTEETLVGRIFAELDMTVTAALVGLSFATARETGLYTLSTLRHALKFHSTSNDVVSLTLVSSLLHKVVEELRERYKGERQIRETAIFDAYGSKGEDNVKSSQEIERLILGGSLLGQVRDEQTRSSESGNNTNEEPKAEVSEDFVLFPDSPDNKADSIKLSHLQYEGLGKALDNCHSETQSNQGSSENAEKCLQLLASYLDAWDTNNAEDIADTELVARFSTNMQLLPDAQDKFSDKSSSTALTLSGTETAADTMSSFFEFAAFEKSRLKDIFIRHLPSNRCSRVSYVDRFSWAKATETYLSSAETEWERAVNDGNRDVRSRLPTFPCNPQFRRFIPKYLDHNADLYDNNQDNNDTSKLQTSSMGDITKTLLEAGDLQIIDITKQVIYDDEPDIDVEMTKKESMDNDDDFFLDESGLSEANDKEGQSKPGDDNASNDGASLDDASTDGMTKGSITDDMGMKAPHHSVTSSSFATPPDNAASSISLMNSAAAGLVEMHVDSCLHVKPEGSRQCSLLLTATHLILEYSDVDGFFEGELLAVQEEVDRQRMIEEGGGNVNNSNNDNGFNNRSEKNQREMAALRPRSIRWNLSEISHTYLRRYRLRDSSIELFFIPSGGTSFGGYGVFSPASSLFLDFGPGKEGNIRRDDVANAVMQRSPPQALKQWPDRSQQFLHDQLNRLTIGWAEGRVTNFDYLLHLNVLAGRSYNDICQYPVFPWVLADYTSDEIPDLTDPKSFRDLSKPVGALNPERLSDFLERFETFADPSIPPFMYGSHYSTSAGVVLHFLVRLHPFSGLHRQLQGGHFDVADRLFSSVPRTWGMCTGMSAAEVKELTPEWYCNPLFLKNNNNFKLGTSQDGETLGDVVLPPWAKKSPERFVEVMRAALESDICSEKLPDWIDLIFGRKQQGPEAIKANNVFFYLTYYGSVDLASIKDESLRQATELQIAHFGQCPMQIFKRPHVRRIPTSVNKLSLYQLMSLYSQVVSSRHQQLYDESQTGSMKGRIYSDPLHTPFASAQLSRWVHLDAPPPGPHAALISVRFAGIDRCLAVDEQGIFHTFRWAWRTDDGVSSEQGCFIAQRELSRFRVVPRLMFVPEGNVAPVVAISKTLFAGRSVLLVIAASDQRGSLGIQLVDPAKGTIRGEVSIPYVHSARITCIATDPIGTAAGHGGVGGELVVVGSADGHASIWRYMSSHYLPLRPRLVLSGHCGDKLLAVALCAAIHIAVSVSRKYCCIFSTGNGNLIRRFEPPVSNLVSGSDNSQTQVTFADTAALAVSVQGYIVAVCEETLHLSDDRSRKVKTLHLFDLEGNSVGCKPLEDWRGMPQKIQCTPDGTAAIVCSGRGVTFHRLSSCHPLDYLDEWQISQQDQSSSSETSPAAYDVDFGPSISRPIVAACACSKGALRLHALPGISNWSKRHTKVGLTQSMGSALSKPAKRLNQAVREGLGFGRQIAGMGRDIGREVTSDVKERGVSGFLGNMVFRKNNK